jgi:hypothetical protein
LYCRKILVILTALALILLSTQTVYAKDYSMSKSVTGNHQWLVYIPVNSGDYITGNFSVMDAFNTELFVQITDPNGAKILDLGQVTDTNQFSFTAQSTGTYTLNFSNPYTWDTNVALYVQTPEEETSLSPTPQTTAAPAEPYVFMGLTAFAFAMVIAVAIYAFAKSGAPHKLAGHEKDIKILERKMNFSLLGVTIGMLMLFSAITYLYTPYIFWATVLPDSFMQAIDPNAGLIAVASLISMLAGFAIIFAMIALLGYYGRKIRRIKTQTAPMQSNPQNSI